MNLNVFRWRVAIVVYCVDPMSEDLRGALASIPELTCVDPVVGEPHRRYLNWQIRSGRDARDELDDHVEDVLARLRPRQHQLLDLAALGAEIALEVLCVPPRDLLPGLLIQPSHVAELGVLQASISFEVVES